MDESFAARPTLFSPVSRAGVNTRLGKHEKAGQIIAKYTCFGVADALVQDTRFLRNG